MQIGGQPYKIDTDFRRWIAFQSLFTADKSDEEKLLELTEFMKELALPTTNTALEEMLKFFAGAVAQNTGQSSAQTRAAFDFEQDCEYIYSAFLTQYGIDLACEKLHWFKFKSLFKSLSSELEFCKIMHYRTVNIKDLPKEQRQYYLQMKARYALRGQKRMSAAEYEQHMKEHVAKRYRETGLAKGGE